MCRHIRTAIAWLFMVLCVGLVAVWMRGYSMYSELIVHSPFGPQSLVFFNAEGRASFLWQTHEKLNPLLREALPFVDWRSRPSEPSRRPQVEEQEKRTHGFLGFNLLRTPDPRQKLFCAPYWPFILLTAALAMLFKPRPRFKFRVRDLMILTVAVAIVFSAVIAFTRSVA